jgi:hypothetical protein
MPLLPATVTLWGIVNADPDISEDLPTGQLRIRFTLAYSRSKDPVRDTGLLCVLFDGVSRKDVAAFLYTGAAVVVTGRLRLPDDSSDRLLLEVTDLEEDGDCEDRRDTPGTVVALNAGPLDVPIPVSVTTVDGVDGCTVVVCERTDGPPLRYLLTAAGACVVVYSEDLVAPTATWLRQSQA